MKLRLLSGPPNQTKQNKTKQIGTYLFSEDFQKVECIYLFLIFDLDNEFHVF